MKKYALDFLDTGKEALRIAVDSHCATYRELLKPIYAKEEQKEID